MFYRLFKNLKRNRQTIEKTSVAIKESQKKVEEDYNNLINQQLERQKAIEEATKGLDDYFSDLTKWFEEQDALDLSVERAREAGVPEHTILHNEEEGERFFME